MSVEAGSMFNGFDGEPTLVRDVRPTIGEIALLLDDTAVIAGAEVHEVEVVERFGIMPEPKVQSAAPLVDPLMSGRGRTAWRQF